MNIFASKKWMELHWFMKNEADYFIKHFLVCDSVFYIPK